MKSRRRYERIGLVFLLGLAVMVGSLGWLTYREIRQEKLNRALFAAIRANQPENAIRLLQEGADASARDNGDQRLSLHHYLTNLWNRLRGLKKPPEQDKRLTPLLAMYQVGEDGLPFIHPENTRLLKAILENGANVDARDKEDATALMWTVIYGDNDSVHLLISHKADVNAIGYYGFTVLMMAMYGDTQKPGIVRALLNLPPG